MERFTSRRLLAEPYAWDALVHKHQDV